MDRALRDGYEVHRAALAHGFNVALLPRQVMEVENTSGTIKTSFSHGIPQQSTLAAVTYAQDARMRRDMVMRAGYSIPTGATFSMGGSERAPYRYVENSLGYPVVVKPAVGDNTIDVLTGISDEDQLRQAIEFFHTPPAERPGYTRAAYALTELREPGMKDGRVVVPPGYRFLVEEQVRGHYLRILVLGEEVVNILHCADGPWQTPSEDIKDVTGEVDSSLKELAAGVAAAIPGIGIAAVDIVSPTVRGPVSVDEAKVVEYSERPWLAVQHSHDPELAKSLAERILSFGIGNALPEPRAHIAVEYRLSGSVHPEDLVAVLSSEFSQLGLEGRAEVVDLEMGNISGELQGPPADIAWIMESVLQDSGLQGQRAMLVEQRQGT